MQWAFNYASPTIVNDVTQKAALTLPRDGVGELLEFGEEEAVQVERMRVHALRQLQTRVEPVLLEAAKNESTCSIVLTRQTHRQHDMSGCEQARYACQRKSLASDEHHVIDYVT